MSRRFRSRALAVLLSLVLVAPVAAQPEPYTLSERVGETLEPAERAYFGLFPDAEGFALARAFAMGDSVRVVIAREAAPDTAVTMPQATAAALGRFVETFELHRTAFYNSDWQVIKDYVRADVPVPYAGDSRGATVFADGGRYLGQVTYASDSLVLINPRGSRFDWQTFEAKGTALRTDEIDGVLLVPGWLGRPYVALAGAPLGIGVNELLMSLTPNEDRNRLERTIFAAAFGVVAAKMFSMYYARTKPYEEAQPAVERAAWFTADRHPLEMPPEEAIRAQVADRPSPTPKWRRTFGWLSLGTGGLSLRGNSQAYSFATTFDPDADPERAVRYEGRGALIEAAAALQPFAWLDVGIGVYMASDQGFDGADLQEVASSQPFFRIFADLDVIRLFDADNRFGFSVGGGLLRSESRVAFNVPPLTGQSGVTFIYSPSGYVHEEAAFEPFYQATVTMGVARETLAYVSLQAFSPPSVDVPLFESAPDVSPDVTVYRVEPHTVSFDYLGLSVGARLNF